ncbi:hypothetical protein [Phaeobacter sp. 11ANDIMAR09]|uniref:hypothetical protein n=1 Tax=Phaeobacter sp. 11ANDIMAR09 TaxID=1225647 RepID=UPI0006C8892B|nr:hypothetical protein [Phaeobacter sp. 11ANDIMAR09]KPD13149.1 hypothetical protein AN476_07615 [Phaeobacter sp. 11ANDIMAR09]
MNDLKNKIFAFLKYLVTEQKPNKQTQPTPVNSGESPKPQLSSTTSDAFVMPVRKTPVGTELVRQNNEQAVMAVQAAIRFWCWVGPTMCLSTILVTLPIGGALGYQSSFDRYGYVTGSLGGNIVWGCILGVGASLFATFLAYTMTRPTVRVEVDKDFVTFGSYKFDRRFADGLRPAYSSQEVELNKSITQPKFGVTALRFAYGPWGEDMKYLVDANYVNDICAWMNMIIDTVGAEAPKENDASEGKKVELL